MCNERFAALAEEHRPALLARARRLCRDHAEAEDLVHDTLERGLRAFPTVRDGQRGRGWLFAILGNAFVDGLRRRRSRQVADLVESSELPTPAVQPPQLWERFDADDVWHVVAQLPAELRLPFHLYVVEGQDYVSISLLLGIPKGTVGTRLLRARHAIRAMLLAA